MNDNLQQRSLFTTALVVSCVLHVFLFLCFFIKLPGHSSLAVAKNNTEQPVKAVAIKQQDVEHEMARIEHQKQLEEQHRQQELNRYRHKIARAKKHQHEVEQSVKALNAKQREINKSIKAAKLLAQKRAHDAQAKKQQLEKLAQEQKALQDQINKHKTEIQNEKKRKELAELKKKKEQLDKIAKLRAKELQDSLQKQMQSEQEQLAKIHAQQVNLEIAKYKQKIVSTVSRSWLMPKNIDKNLSCQLLIHLGPGGVVLDVSTIKSSGNALLDRSAKTAILKASPLPVPTKQELFEPFRELRLTVRPEGIRAA